MRSHQQLLIQFLSEETTTSDSGQIERALKEFPPEDAAEFFVDVAFINSAMQFIKEQHWIKIQDSSADISFVRFIKSHLKLELKPILFLHSFLENLQIENIEPLEKKALKLTQAVIEQVKKRPSLEKKTFASISLKRMSELFEIEHQLDLDKKEKGLHLGLTLYRSFDILDEVFNLNYEAETGMKAVLENKERLFEGAGVGVQSSYATILMMLRYLKIAPKSKFIDLGSGYGRVGLVVGLMRPDVDCTGYEYVPHRVDIANSTATDFEMESQVNFITQDLSAKDFKIPAADVYYIYDSFSDDTYAHVLPQLATIAQTQKVTVITKGNAKIALMNSTQKGNWSPPQQFESGNFCLFRSK